MQAAPRGGASVTVLIPAHDEAATIRAVAAGALAQGVRVLVISDGSTDGTVAALDGLPVEVIAHAENRGKGPRLAEGLDHAFEAGAEAVLTMDADGQHDPADIPAFLAAAQAAPRAIVMGDRSADRAAMPRLRAAGIAFGDFFIGWACGRRIRDAQCGMRLYPAALWRAVRLDPGEQAHFVFETAVLMHGAEAGFGLVRVPIKARYAGFQQRPSHYRPLRDTLRIVRAVTRFLVRRRFRPRGLLIALGLMR